MPATDSGFNEPAGVAVDANNVFVADSVNQRIQRFSATGTWQLHFGHRGWGSDLSGLNWPRDVAIEQSDPSKLWVTDTKNGRMLEFTRDGAPTGRTFGTQGTALGQFRRIDSVSSTSDGVVVVDTLNNRVQRWRTSGTPSLTWNADGFSTPKSVDVVGGTAYVADTGHNRVVELSLATGAVTKTIGGLHSPEGIAVTPAGDIWVADTGANRLVELSAAGSTMQTFGSMGTSSKQFNNPTELDVFNGKLYVCDTYNDRVQVYSIS